MTMEYFEASTSNAAPYTLLISHAGQTHPISLSSSATTLHDLRVHIADLTSVPISNQKLIYKGKTLSPTSDDSSLSSLWIADKAKLLLIGSKVETVSAFVKEGTDLQRRYELSSQRQPVQVRKTASAGKMVMDLNDLRRSGANAFDRIEVLERCPHEDLRRERLVKLSKDEAVLECMKSREWTVGLLSELHPHRDPTLLGLNKNAGEAIYLRLLTDDLSGLRSYAHTRMVLLHEITHNKYGDHDESFKTLNSLLNKEVKAFEANKRAGAHRLGGEIHDAYEGDEAQLEQMCGSSGGHGAASSRSGTPSSAKKGTTTVREEDGLWEMDQRRQAMLKAAEDRAKTGRKPQ